jgi:hypothetical protein
VPYLNNWNGTSGKYGGSFGVRHDGAFIATAADGHSTRLKLAPYQPGSPNPSGWIELGDTRSDTTGLWTATGKINLYMREKNSNDGF